MDSKPEKPSPSPPIQSRRAELCADERGTAIVEAAFALPLMIALLLGAISYGTWFMSAHSIQQAVNDAARASLAGMDQAEREEIVVDVVQDGVLAAGTVDLDNVLIQTELSGNLFTVRAIYNPSDNLLLANSLIPLPQGNIVRTASVRLTSI